MHDRLATSLLYTNASKPKNKKWLTRSAYVNSEKVTLEQPEHHQESHRSQHARDSDG
jgi:hypothetical protein